MHWPLTCAFQAWRYSARLLIWILVYRGVPSLSSVNWVISIKLPPSTVLSLISQWVQKTVSILYSTGISETVCSRLTWKRVESVCCFSRTYSMLYFLVIVCLFGCFSAAQGDSQCLTSTRALMATTSCYEAVGNVTQRTQDAMQFAMACTNGEQCKDLWRAMINDCNPVSLQVCMSH